MKPYTVRGPDMIVESYQGFTPANGPIDIAKDNLFLVSAAVEGSLSWWYIDTDAPETSMAELIRYYRDSGIEVKLQVWLNPMEVR